MNVSLRPWRRDDAVALQRLANDPLVTRWMSASFPSPYTIEIAQQWLAEATSHDPPHFVAIEESGTIVGGAGIEPCDGSHTGVAIIGYWIGREYWGRGIASRAAELLVERASAYGFRRLQASVFEPNAASARVLEKAGFVREARLRKSYVDRDGRPMDELIYGLVVR